MTNTHNCPDDIVLHSDNGASLHFKGRLFSESTCFDDATGALVRLRLFSMQGGGQVYSIITTAGSQKHRRYYVMRPIGELCEVSDGVQTITLPVEMLFNAVFGLCGIDPSQAESLRPSFEESLKSAVNT